MNALQNICFVIWIYVLSVLKRGKLHFWYFVTGSAGLFIFLMIMTQPYLVGPLSKAVTAVAGILGSLTHTYTSNFEYGILFIQREAYSITLNIDFECAGVIETLAFTALLWFFSIYKFYEKLVVNILGVLVIFIGNVIRIFCICELIYFMGNEVYYIAHTIIGRLIFYAISILLYYFVFTKAQIKRQKVGVFEYEHS